MKPGALLYRLNRLRETPPSFAGGISSIGAFCDQPCTVAVCFFTLWIGPSVSGTPALIVENHFPSLPDQFNATNHQWTTEVFCFEISHHDD